MGQVLFLRSKWLRRLLYSLFSIGGIYSLMLVPDSKPAIPNSPDQKPFTWNQDTLWQSYEQRFIVNRSIPCENVQGALDSSFKMIQSQLVELDSIKLQAHDKRFRKLEQQFFNLGLLIGACENYLDPYLQLSSQIRKAIKKQSQHWDMGDRASRETLYRLLYGGRAAIEEIMLQISTENQKAFTIDLEEPSMCPSAEVLGVKLHSGDILVSRGGAAASALISRGNDFPGNFSHVALVHIDETTKELSIIEAHIEKGVAIADVETYLADKKLRIMALRPRADLPELINDPMLPHKAATFALEEAQSRHIPYDFEMNFEDPSKKFCSEIAYDAYAQLGIKLWMGISSISSPGLLNWLSAIGVTYFETHEPADLEYDPQLVVVAEWRDLETLFDDHLDNAILDVMLERADTGEELVYSMPMLPLARFLKAYSWSLNQMGEVGPVPEGMSATTALKIDYFSTLHASIKAETLKKIETYRKEKAYTPPYWELLQLVREAFK